MPEFTNGFVPASSLPHVDEERFEKLSPRYRSASLLSRGAFLVALAGVGTAVNLIFGPHWVFVTVTASLFVLGLVGVVLFVFEVERRGYQIRDHDLSYRSGLLLRSIATVPFSRVQNVVRSTGLIERRFGLATLSIETAQGSVTVPGLVDGVADQLRSHIITKATELGDYDHAPQPTQQQ